MSSPADSKSAHPTSDAYREALHLQFGLNSGQPVDRAQAIRVLEAERARAELSLAALSLLAELYHATDKENEAIELWEKAIAGSEFERDPHALFTYSLNVLRFGKRRDPTRFAALSAAAVAGLSKRAESGDARAQNDLADCFHGGHGTLSDPKQAFKFYELAAKQGHCAAQKMLHFYYTSAHGKVVTRDEAAAVRWLTLAAQQGDVGSCEELAARFEDGDGVDADLARAIAWYARAAELGSQSAQQRVAVLRKDATATAIAASALVEVKWTGSNANASTTASAGGHGTDSPAAPSTFAVDGDEKSDSHGARSNSSSSAGNDRDSKIEAPEPDG